MENYTKVSFQTIYISALFCLLLLNHSYAQEFTSSTALPLNINVGTNYTNCTSPGDKSVSFNVSGVNPLNNTDNQLGDIKLQLDASCGGTNLTSIEAYIVSPSGTCAQLAGTFGTSFDYSLANSILDYSFRNEVFCLPNEPNYNAFPTSVFSASNVSGRHGIFKTIDDIATLFQGEDPNGTWTIYFASPASGRPCLTSASITFGDPRETDHTSDGDTCDDAVFWDGSPICLSTIGKTGTQQQPGFNNPTDPTQRTTNIGPSWSDYVDCNWNNRRDNGSWLKFVPTDTDVCISISGLVDDLQSIVIKPTSPTSCTNVLAPGEMLDTRWEVVSCPRNAIYGAATGTTRNHNHCFTAVPGEEYYLLVDGNFGAMSDYYLEGISGLPFNDPEITCPADFGVCIDEPDFELNVAIPAGGTYSGNGVSGNIFSPTDAGAGTHTITYTHEGESCTFDIEVIDSPDVDNPEDVEACDSYELPPLTNGEYYSETQGGGTQLNPGDEITNSQTIYIYNETGTTPNCWVEESFTVTIHETPEVDNPEDIEACDNYELPPLSNGEYYTETEGGGTQLNPGDQITTSQTVYIYNETGTNPNCWNEESFIVTIHETPEVDNPDDVEACDSYELPPLTNGEYYTETQGDGTQLNPGDEITNSQTIFIYSETGTTPNCWAEESFTITIHETPEVDSPEDVEVCDSYELPPLTNGTYFTETQGGGTQLNPGDQITSTQTIFVYNDSGTDPNCWIEETFEVVIHDSPEIDLIETTNPACGENDGSFTIHVGGGEAPYDYVIGSDPAVSGGASITFDDLSSGSYSISITDANNCTVSGSVNLNDEDGPDVEIIDITEILCYDGANGELTADASGGTGNLSIEWSNGETTETITNISSGTYNVTVTDENDCIATASVTLDNPDELLLDIIETNHITCHDLANGSIEANTTGGTPNYEFELTDLSGTVISGPQTNGEFDELAPGDYIIVVTDGNGCDQDQTIEITQPDELTLTFDINDETCGDENGSIIVNVSGGTPDFTYTLYDEDETTIIEGPQPGNSFIELPGGEYHVEVIDENDCEIIQTVVLENIGEPDVTVSVSEEISCYEICDGEITAEALTGIAPFEFVWEDSDGNHLQTNIHNDSDVLTGVCQGIYTVIITDDNGDGPCPATHTITISEPDSISFDVTLEDQICDENGSISFVDVSGGTPPYTFSIDGGNTDSPSDVFEDVASGTYTLVVTDMNGCEKDTTVTIDLIDNPPVVGSFESTSITCFGDSDGQITIDASSQNGGDVSYSIDGGVTFQENGLFEDLAAGDYTIIIQDEFGCETTIVDVTVENTSPITVEVLVVNETCLGDEDGELIITDIEGGNGGYIVEWEDEPNENHLENLTPGAYHLTVTDSEGCSYTNTYVIGTNDFTGDFFADPTSGVVPLDVDFDYSGDPAIAVEWDMDTGDTLYGENVSYIFEENGSYEVTMVATDGQCTDTLTITIVVEGESHLEVPNIFSPNGDGVNDVFKVNSDMIAEFNMQIYNRWGQLLYEIHQAHHYWDGKTNAGVNASEGVYFYVLSAKGLDGVEYDKQGSFHLVR